MRWSRRFDPWLLGALSLCLRLGVVAWAWGRVPPTADGKFYHVVAQRIAAGEGYTWLWSDGAVTFAAHYPVGYPALMALPYRVFGAQPGVVMVINAFLGALTVVASHHLCVDAVRGKYSPTTVRIGAGAAGLLLAFSPTLLAYTPALMTEGAVAAFLVFSSIQALRSRRDNSARGGLFSRVLLVVFLGAAVLLRPQSILFAPVLGYLSVRGKLRKRVVAAVLVSLGCLSIVAPWTLRNCDKMDRCVFVSANGGWNLLIGTFREGKGAWVPIDGARVPQECRNVFQEAAKDECFGRAGRRRILEDPWRWIALVPAKLRATLDFTAAGADHLFESGALSGERKRWLSYPEFFFQRLGFLLVLYGAAARASRVPGSIPKALPLALFAIGAVGFLGMGAIWGWGGFLALMSVARRDLESVGVGVAVFAVLATIVVHAVFFGAGRYALPLIPLSAPLTAVGIGELLERLGYASPALASGHEV